MRDPEGEARKVRALRQGPMMPLAAGTVAERGLAAADAPAPQIVEGCPRQAGREAAAATPPQTSDDSGIIIGTDGSITGVEGFTLPKNRPAIRGNLVTIDGDTYEEF